MKTKLLRRILILSGFLFGVLARLPAADTTPPAILSITPAPGSTVSNLTQVTIVFNEPVTGVMPGNLQVNGGDADAVSGTNSTNFVFTFTQPPPGQVLFYFDIDQGITDLAGNYFDSVSVGSWQILLQDNIPPVAASILPSPGATLGNLSQVQLMFSEPVTNVHLGDLLVNGSPIATSLTGSGAGPYLFQFPSQPAGSNFLAWSSGQAIRDLATTPNAFAGGIWSYLIDPSAAAGNIVINEFLSSAVNTNGLADEDGQLSDWIELYNRGTNTVNLNGWSLTIDPAVPSMWTFPAVTLGPGQYLVLFASGKDRKVTVSTNKMHTNFELGTASQYLGLFTPDLPPQAASEFAPGYPEQRNDVTYGYDSTNGLKYFLTPTPGGPNGASTVSGVVAPVHFSVESGFFNAPFNLVLTTPTHGATIRYTTDYSEPTLGNGTNYTGPLQITNLTIVRAAAFQNNVLPSLVETRRFFYVEDIVRQSAAPAGYPTGLVWTTPATRAYYPMEQVVVTNALYSNVVRSCLTEIPTISIVSSLDNLFGPTSGIYTHVANSATQYRGPGWERPCSAEYILPDGSSGFRIDCGVQIQGGTSRDPTKSPKHSFRLNFKSAYSFANLHYRIFPDSPADKFNTFVLDLGINYWWHYNGTSSPTDQRQRAQCVRDQFVSDLQNAMGKPSFHGRFAHVYLNNLYWGICYIHERPDEDWAAEYFGGNSGDYDVIKNTTYGNEQVSGDTVAYNTMIGLATAGLVNNAQYEAMQQYCDIDNLIDFMTVNIWAGNDDWPQHNWYVMRKRQPGAGFKFITWDAEHVMKSLSLDRTGVTDAGPAQVYAALRNNAEFRLRFADHLQKHFFNGGVLYTDPNPTNAVWDAGHPERNQPAAAYMRRITEITNAIVAESARWGGYELTTNYTRNDQWLNELRALLGVSNNTSYAYTWNYLPNRSATVLQQFRNAGLFPNTPAPSFSQFGGRVAAGYQLYVTNNTNAGTIYYTTNGADPRVYGSGAVASTAQIYTNGVPIVLNVSTEVKARLLFTNGVWSALVDTSFNVGGLGLPLRITELMYNPIGGDNYEFLELQNIGSTPVNIGNFNFVGITFTFPSGTIINPGDRLVLASNNNTNAWKARYSGVNVAGWYSGKLSNTGERIALLDPLGNTITAVDYSNTGGWPVSAGDGSGYSLEVIDPNGDPEDPANWRASSTVLGTPALGDNALPAPSILLNEVMAENLTTITNGGTYPDWVELFNPGAGSVDLANWSLRLGGASPPFTFPTNSIIGAGGYLVVWCDTNSAAPGLHTGFTLGRKGENLFLYDAGNTRVDAISFGSQIADLSLGRVSGVWRLTTPTPGAANVALALGSSTNLAINEWLAGSPVGASDWVELFNRSSNAPVALRNIYLGTSNDLFQIQALSFLPPRGYIQLFADELPGPDHLDFKLHAAGDAIILSDETGGELSRVTFGAQTDNVSQGRLPDGAASIVSFPGTASPGASNYVSSYTGPFLNEVLAKNSAAVTNSYGRVADYLELFNPYTTNFPLAGMSVSVDQAHPGQWVFPPGATINAQGYLVVWCDGGAPASLALEANLNTGHAINGDSSGVYLFNAGGQLLDFVEFGFQVKDRPIGKSGGVWRLLSSATPGAANSGPATLGATANLRINEWLASSVSGDDWFELFNSDNAPVSLAGLYVTDDPSLSGQTNTALAPLSFIAGRGFVKVTADGSPSKGRDHANFSLDSLGETIRIYNPNLSLIDAVDFGLAIDGVAQGRLPDGAATFVNFPSTATPGESNYLPPPNVLVNEVLSHTDLPLEDAVELFNPSPAPASVAGWFLSNTSDDFKKYRIPGGTTIGAGGFLVLYENQFNSTNATTPFTFNSAHGDQVWISAADAFGNLTGFRATASFGAAENGVSFGRYDTSLGTEFTALNARTFGVDNPTTVQQFRAGAGLTNAAPKIGPVVITELMYHPPDIGGTNDDTLDEYIELYNVSGSDVAMYDPAYPTNQWRLQDGVSFTFTNISIPAGAYVLVVSFDPVANPGQLGAFRSRYGLSLGVPIYGPYTGKLSNSGEAVELVKPDAPQAAPHPDVGYVPYIRVDRVAYGTAAPWPSGPDGYPSGIGLSLQRRDALAYGNEPLNWLAGYPTPGAASGPAFIALPAITQQPQNTGGMAGTNVSFNVTASGSLLNYQWRLNGLNLSGATNATIIIPAIQSANEGSYTVFISNPAGSVLSSVATLTVAAPPTITQQPQTQVASVGNTITFTVLATGGNLSYQWRFYGTNLAGATNSSLALTNVQTAAAGPYSVVVANTFTPVPSDTAYLVMAAPAITQQPQSQTNNAGATATFTVVASGDAPLSYQWRKNGGAISGATNSTLLLSGLQTNDAGGYQALVFNPAGNATTIVATLSVVIPLQILTQPTNQVTNPGSNVAFVVSASGTGLVKYQWRNNGVAITNNPTATNSSLLLTNVQLADNANYSVFLTDDLMSLTSSNASLIVRVRPAITQQPASVTLALGGTANFSISATGTFPMGYRWRRGLIYLPDAVGLFSLNANTSIFSITNVQASDATNYNVAITNIAGAPVSGLSANAYLTVVVPPTNQTAIAGSNVTFSAAAFGSASVQYRWQFNGSDIPGATNSTLALSGVQSSNAGPYAVVVSVVTNVTVAPATFPATLTVLSQAVLSQPLLTNGSFQMRLQGTPNQTYVIDISTNMTNWSVLTNIAYTNGQMLFLDSTATNSQRFYRTRIGP